MDTMSLSAPSRQKIWNFSFIFFSRRYPAASNLRRAIPRFSVRSFRVYAIILLTNIHILRCACVYCVYAPRLCVLCAGVARVESTSGPDNVGPVTSAAGETFVADAADARPRADGPARATLIRARCNAVYT